MAISTCAAAVAGVFGGCNLAPSPAAEALVSGRGHLLVVGDSLTLEANENSGLGYDFLRTKMPSAPERNGLATDGWRSVTVAYKKGQRVAWGGPIIRAALRQRPGISAIVVALGTNDVAGRHGDWAKRIRGLLDAADGRPITWLTVELSPTSRGLWRRNAREFNDALRAVDSDPTYAEQLTIADWAAWFPGSCSRPATFTSDGIHLRRPGNRCRALFMIDISVQVHAALFPG